MGLCHGHKQQNRAQADDTGILYTVRSERRFVVSSESKFVVPLRKSVDSDVPVSSVPFPSEF